MVLGEPKVLIDGLVFGEDPRWHNGALWFSDIHGQQIHRAEIDGSGDLQRHDVIADVEEAPSGLGWLPDGSLLVVAMESQRLLRLDAGGTFHVHADCSDLARGSLNDMIVRTDGTAYVGDMGSRIFSEHPDHSVPGQTLRVAPDGTVSCAADNLKSPNGHVLSDDERVLYVAESGGGRLLAFDVQSDGQITGQRVFADLPPADGLPIAPPDGICLDAEGAIWAADPIGHRVIRVLPSGELTNVVEFGEQVPVAVVLAGPQRQTLIACVAGHWKRDEVLKARKGQIVALTVDVPGAGKP
jgi:sugar lactone lactonase YvrE